VAGGLLLAACDSKPPAPKADANGGKSAAVELPATLFVEAVPAEAVELAAAKTTAKAGDTVVVHGRIGGSRDPFIEDRAIFTLADMSMKTCSERHGDGCKTPWDYCCEPSEAVVANTATVQVVDAQGKVLKAGLNGAGGLKPMVEVVVKGRVSQKPDDKILVIDAAVIYVKKS
jgi:hypothetical protein